MTKKYIGNSQIRHTPSSCPGLQTKNIYSGNESIDFYTVGKGKKTLIFFITDVKEYPISPSVKCKFDGRFLQTFRNDEIILSHPAHFGEAFCIEFDKENNIQLSKTSLPTKRGEKIAWALSFVGKEKCKASEADFFKTYEELVNSDLITNIAVFSKFGRYALAVADMHFPMQMAPNGRHAVVHGAPVLAWISDDITSEELTELLSKYSVRNRLPCSKEFFYLL